jgi:hypothetical protein
MIASIVVPLRWRSKPSTVSCLEERAEASGVFEAAVLVAWRTLAALQALGADRLVLDFEDFDFALRVAI